MARIVMLLSNAFRPDPRVLKEARSLTKAGYKVTIICWDREGELTPQEYVEGIDIRRLTIRSGYSRGSRQIFYLPRFWHAALVELRKLKPDVVHCHDLDTTVVGYWYARAHHIPWIFDAHECYPEQIGPQTGRVIYRFLLFLERWMTQKATHVVTVGELLAQRFRALGGTVSVVGNYQELATFKPRPSISRMSLGLHSNEFVVAYVGGFTLARAIFPLIQATKLFQDVTILLAGDGPQREKIEAELPDYPRVRYLKWIPQEQVLNYMALADVIYYGLNITDGNSQYSSPNALFNALAVGKPILTTDVGEIAHIVQEEQCGVVVREATPELLAGAMEQLHKPDFCEQLANNAYRVAKSKYNWAIAEKNLFNVYQQIVSQK